MRPGGGSVNKEARRAHPVDTASTSLTLCQLTMTVMDLESRLRRADDTEFLLQTER
jgi:hypothetical protein